MCVRSAPRSAGWTETELIENAELKGATPLMEFAAAGATTFTY